MHPQIEPKLDWNENIGPYQFSHRAASSPYEAGKYAPHLHIAAYHESVRKVRIFSCPNEIIRMDIPRRYTLNDTKRFVAEHEQVLFDQLKMLLDSEVDVVREPLTCDSKIPYGGKDYPIRILPENAESNGQWSDEALYLKAGLSSESIREASLDLLGEMAYATLKPKVDHISKKMKIKYSGLEIDDGRRTFGTFNIITKEIFLSRRLLMMSEDLIDFLIIHELAHAVAPAHGGKHDAEMARMLANHDALDFDFNESCSDLLLRGWI